MLYKKNTSASLQSETFKNPSAEYRCTPFWALNCKLDKELMFRQIDHFKDMGFGGAHMHVRTGLATEYLSDEFMDIITACCNKFESNDMLGWLYDEDRYSSGYAGGKVTCDPRFRRRELHFYCDDQNWDTPKAEAIPTGVPYLVACYDVVLNEDGTLKSYNKINKGDTPKGEKWFAYAEPDHLSTWHNNFTYVDVMNREATEKFIETTYDLYYKWVGDKFDKSVPAIFTDEPQIMHKFYQNILPEASARRFQRFGWSRFFEEEYTARYGEDITEKLPMLIWYCADRSDAEFKYRYYDLCAELFQQNFCKVLGDWCEAHNIAFTGHLLDEPALLYQMFASGECMRHYGYFQIPGIDMLSNNYQYTTAKQCQSVVHQMGREGMMSELYGVTNWDFDFMGHKSQGDWQAALGITVRVPHLSWLSMAGESKRDYPASISYQSPWFKEYPFIEDHFARVNTALTRGKAIVNIGVIHPIESMWLTHGPLKECGDDVDALENDFKNITEWLIKNHLDFDFICEATLPEMSNDSDPMAVGQSRYKAIVVPKCICLRSTTIAYLRKFAEAGGKVIFTDACPKFVDGRLSDLAEEIYANAAKAETCSGELALALDCARDILIETNKNHGERFIYNYRQDTDCRWLFIARRYQAPKDETEAQTLTIKVVGGFVPMEYNTVTGEIIPVDYRIDKGETYITKKLYSYDNLLLKLTEAAEGSYTSEVIAEEIGNELKTDWTYSLNEGNALLLDQAEFALDDGQWRASEEMLRLDNVLRDELNYPPRQGHLAQPYTIKTFTEGHTAHLRFTFQSEIEVDGALLAIEDAELNTMELNGQTVPNTPIGYFTDEAIKTVALPKIKKGENVLTVHIPFKEDTNIEWCYILGDFGVGFADEKPFIKKRPENISFGDIVNQGLPFYSANVSYSTKITAPNAGVISVATPEFIGAAVTLDIDGKRIGNLSLPPFAAKAEISAGEHTVTITLYGNRFNCFGQLHCTNFAGWLGPEKWRTEGEEWTYGYNLRPIGIMQAPKITFIEK